MRYRARGGPEAAPFLLQVKTGCGPSICPRPRTAPRQDADRVPLGSRSFAPPPVLWDMFPQRRRPARPASASGRAAFDDPSHRVEIKSERSADQRDGLLFSSASASLTRSLWMTRANFITGHSWLLRNIPCVKQTSGRIASLRCRMTSLLERRR
jgi:hypothetical protein